MSCSGPPEPGVRRQINYKGVMINELRQRLDLGLLHKAASTSLLSGVTDHELNTRVGVTIEPGPRRWSRVPLTKAPNFSVYALSSQLDGSGRAPPLGRSRRRCLCQGLVPDAAPPLATAHKRKFGTTTERSCVQCLPPHFSELAAFQRDRK